jgi:methionyl-tRNA synthetase
MAKRKERALARKGTASKRGKVGKKVKYTPRKSAKRTGVKVSAKKTARRVASKTKAKKLGIKPRARQASKKVGPRPTKSSRRAAAATEETVIVDIVEEPVPGVMVVTEFESVRTSELEAPSPRADGEDPCPSAEVSEPRS